MYLSVVIDLYSRAIVGWAMEDRMTKDKVELVYENKYKTREEAKTSIFRYIEEYYNRKRMHSAINYRIPN